MVEVGVILECNTHGTLVLTASRFGPKRAFFSCNYKTEHDFESQQTNRDFVYYSKMNQSLSSVKYVVHAIGCVKHISMETRLHNVIFARHINNQCISAVFTNIWYDTF